MVKYGNYESFKWVFLIEKKIIKLNTVEIPKEHISNAKYNDQYNAT